MINVTDNYKLVDIEVEGESKTVRLDEKPWNVVEVEFKGNTTAIHEGNQIEFIVETGEKVQGILSKILKKKEKTQLQVKLFGSECEVIWAVTSIQEGTLKVIDTTKVSEDVDEDNEIEEDED